MSSVLLAAPLQASNTVEALHQSLERRVSSSSNPVLIIVVAAAIVIGLGFIAFLLATCVAHGYRGFGGVVHVSWPNPLNARVSFACTR